MTLRAQAIRESRAGFSRCGEILAELIGGTSTE